MKSFFGDVRDANELATRHSPLRQRTTEMPVALKLITSITVKDQKWNNLTSNLAWKFLDYQFTIVLSRFHVHVHTKTLTHNISASFMFDDRAFAISTPYIAWTLCGRKQHNKLLIFHVLHNFPSEQQSLHLHWLGVVRFVWSSFETDELGVSLTLIDFSHLNHLQAWQIKLS